MCMLLLKAFSRFREKETPDFIDIMGILDLVQII